MNKRLAALDFITGCLSVRNTPDTSEILHSALASGHLDWQIVLSIANIKKIVPAFWVSLRNRKLAEYLPSEVRECLFKTYLFNTVKNKFFKEQAIKVVRQFNSIGVEPVLLKGSASLFVKTFDDPGSRVMADLDILVPEKSAEGCWDSLRTLGYLPIEVDHHYHIDYDNHHHLRPLYHPNWHGTVEIHREALPSSAARILPNELIWNQSEPVINESGITMRIPSPAHRVLHNLLHSDLINQTYIRGNISLRSLHELVMMQSIYNEKIDWKAIKQLMDKGGQEKVFHASLYLAHRLFGSPLPDQTGMTSGAIIHYARTRLQIGWNWTSELVERAFWFSAQSICERYNCNNSFFSVTKWRIHLAAHLAWKYSRQAFHVIGHQISMSHSNRLEKN